MRQIYFLAVVVANKFNRVFEYSHHAQAEQVNFDDAHVGAIFFVPLHHDAAGHGGGVQRDDIVKLSLEDDHAAGVLSEMAGQILHGETQLVILAQTRMIEVESSIAEAEVEGDR